MPKSFPWYASEMGVIADQCTSHGNFYVCSLIAPDNDEDKANATFIVEACNNYERVIAERDELAQLFDQALTFILETAASDIRRLRPDWFDITERGAAALAKYTERKEVK